MDRLTGEILHRCDGGRTRPGHQYLADVAPDGDREIHLLLTGGGDGEVGHRQVPVAGGKRRQQLVPRDRHEHHADLQRPGVQLVVQEILKGLEHLVGQPPLNGTVEEVKCPAAHHQGPHQAPLGDAFQIVKVRFAG